MNKRSRDRLNSELSSSILRTINTFPLAMKTTAFQPSPPVIQLAMFSLKKECSHFYVFKDDTFATEIYEAYA